jgi:hypothetical protein
MASLFGVHLPFTGYGPQYRVGDTIPGAAAAFQNMPTLRPPGLGGVAPGLSPFGAAIAGRLGLGGLSGVADAFQTAPGAPAPQAPPPGMAGSAPGPTGWAGALGPVGDFIDQHRGMLSDLGKIAGGGLQAYGLVSQLQEQKKEREFEREQAEQKRRDQQAAAAAVAPGYAALLAALAGHAGYGGR